MIDKVDLRIPAMTNWGPLLRHVIPSLKRGYAVGPFKPSRYYALVGDLRKDFDIDAIVHLGYKFGEATHKIEVIDAGKKTLDDMRDIVLNIFDVDPNSLQLMRVDLAADMPDVNVFWFRDHARFLFKQFSSRIEKARETEMQFVAMGHADSQSLYAGKKPNCIRIYDKIAEWQRQWRKIVRDYARFNSGLSDFKLTDEERYYGRRIPPSFEQFCAWEGFHYEKGDVLTRVERQIGGDRFPPELKTFSDLQDVSEFNPFSSIRILKGAPPPSLMPDPAGMSIREWLTIKGYAALTHEMGSAQQAAAMVQRYGKGNGRRILDSISEKLPEERETPVTLEEIYGSYRRSTLPQIVVTSTTRRGIYLGPRNVEKDQTPAGSSQILPETWESRRTETSGTAVPGTP